MINYAKHDEEFYGIFKLVNGEEVLGKAVATEDEGETLVFIQDPVSVHAVTKEIGDTKVVRGIGFAKWMQMSDEEFFILREKDIITVASMSREVVMMYEAYILGDEVASKKMSQNQADIKQTAGYLGKINEARALFEKLFKI